MAYEHEGKLLDYASGSKTYEEYKAMTQELQEVYHKAKAFDEVIKKVKTEFVSEDLADAIHILVNDYEYDKEDKQYGL